MATVTTVDIVNGIPTTGTGTVSTIDALLDVVALESGGNLDDIAAALTSLAASDVDAGTTAAPSADIVSSQGPILHDGAIASANVAPMIGGMKALAHGTNPTAVSAADATYWYANRAGVPWVIGGHPNIIARSCAITSAQSDAALVGTISSGTKYVLTQLSVKAGSDVSGSLTVKIGFGASAVPTTSESGVAGMVYEGEITQGQGQQIGNGAGIIAIGGDGEELRITSDDPGTAYLYVQFSYYTIES